MSRRSGRLEASKEGPKVVVQQVLQVDPLAPDPPAALEPPPEGPQAKTKPELKTRLRPNRSSWRQRFSPPPPSKTKIKREDGSPILPKATKQEPVDEPEPESDEAPADEELIEQEPVEELQEEEQHVMVVSEGIEMADEEPMETVETGSEQTQIMEVITEETSEADRICSVVQQDQLIQQFGLNLVNMSTQPHSRATILAVSQRMIELVRLLRAAQAMNEGIDSLASLFHIDYWPLILESIKYVCGYEEGTAKNPQYIFDIGQALRFCAYILKREAQENENAAYEEQAQQFLDSIEANMSTVSTNQTVTVCTEQPVVEAETVAAIVTEEPSQYRVVLSNNASGDSQPVTLSLQVGNDNMPLPGTVQVVKIISTPSGKKGIIIPTRILSKKV
ncbi:uncharacterized protein LOC132202116 [Neocloeon triangulifer]|uniref:uncharacterized protein LOC132202116 n=1 Tax=Neocloeon triangulifer TaxID=2078957 RepID=UPI00286EE5DB|nr:uncharacterized protein LOC132202116 [Neocloeon triangulifer]